jgi:hypothetical protein
MPGASFAFFSCTCTVACSRNVRRGGRGGGTRLLVAGPRHALAQQRAKGCRQPPGGKQACG